MAAVRVDFPSQGGLADARFATDEDRVLRTLHRLCQTVLQAGELGQPPDNRHRRQWHDLRDGRSREHSVVIQDLLLDLAQTRTGRHAQIVGQHAAGLGDAAECIDLSVASVERDCERCPQPFAIWMLFDQFVEFGDRLVIRAEVKEGLGMKLSCIDPLLGQPRRCSSKWTAWRILPQRPARPECQRLVEELERESRLSLLRRAGVSDQFLKPHHIHCAGLDDERVSVLSGRDVLVSDHLAHI